MKNLKAESLWQKLSLDPKFRKMVHGIRERTSIPIDGFFKEEDYYKWRNKFFGWGSWENESEDGVSSTYYRMLKRIESYATKLTGLKIEYHWNENNFRQLIEEYIHYGKVNSESLARVNATGCELILYDNGKKKYIHNFINEGVYVKIGSTSRPSDINIFLEQNKKEIRVAQEMFARWEKVNITNTKYKISKYTERNKEIIQLNKLDIGELNKMSDSFSTYKDINISLIMNKNGNKVTPENVRKIVQRTKNNV